MSLSIVLSLLLCFIIIYRIAIAYSMGQIIKSVCICQCICVWVSICEHSHGRILKIDFHQNCPRSKNPRKEKRVY